MPKPFTHIIVKYPSKGMDLLYRASDGMALACRNQLTVIAGADPNPAKMTQRNFLDENFAYEYLRTLADLDANHLTANDELTALEPGEMLRFAASIDERFGESKIISAGSSTLRN